MSQQEIQDRTVVVEDGETYTMRQAMQILRAFNFTRVDEVRTHLIKKGRVKVRRVTDYKLMRTKHLIVRDSLDELVAAWESGELQ